MMQDIFLFLWDHCKIHISARFPNAVFFCFVFLAEVRLQQLLTEIEMREQQILRTSEELRQLEETVSQRQVRCSPFKQVFKTPLAVLTDNIFSVLSQI